MTDDLFGPVPAPPKRPRPSDRLRARADQTYPSTFGRAPATPKDPEPAPVLESPPPVPAAAQPCTRPATPNGMVCRVGGGDASFSTDSGRTWLCRVHVPADFFPAGRKRP